MRVCLMLVSLSLSMSAFLIAQVHPSASPQTARQALLEMFLGTQDDSFSRHIPENARKLITQNGIGSYGFQIYRLLSVGRQITGQTDRKETFDAGPTLLATEQNEGRDRFTIEVEHDTMTDDKDEIELSAHLYHDGQEQFFSVIPRVDFILEQQKDVWRLIEVNASARIPLSDPAYLNGLRQREQEGNESAALTRVRSITSVEQGYAERHPDLGYTCALATLFQPEPRSEDDDSSDGNQQIPIYFDPGQLNPEWNGYRVALTGCEGSPASRFRITAVPIDSDSGTKIFCVDESGSIRSSTEKELPACFTQGEVVETVALSPPETTE